VANLKIGLIFENVLKRGLLEFVDTLPLEAPEWRYIYHEIIEEAHHSLMFQEFINRSGCEPRSMTALEAAGTALATRRARHFPELFFVGVLGGEAPIDYEQQRLMRDRDNVHPLFHRIMQIHVTEEARHVSFAKRYLEQNIPKLPWYKKLILSRMSPIILGTSARIMLEPPPNVVKEYQIPKKVIQEAYRDDPRHRQRMAESLETVRHLLDKLGLITGGAAKIWQRMGIDPAPA